jgi:hypothetical protein
MTALTERAATALRRARLADPSFDTRPLDPRRVGERQRLAWAISTLLGIDPVNVTVTDDPDRSYGTWLGYLISVSDEDSRIYRFIPRVGTEKFMILDPCPDCHGIVPIAEIFDLADLGRYLDLTAHGRHVPRPPEFDDDPGHAHTCPHRRPCPPDTPRKW